MVAHDLAMVETGVRFPLPAPTCIHPMSKDTLKIINILHLISEAIIVVCYVASILPGAYFGLFAVVIPLVIVNLVFAVIKKDTTLTYTLVNLAMSILAFIPILGWGAIAIGIIMSVMSIQVIMKELPEEVSKVKDAINIVDVEVKKQTNKETNKAETKKEEVNSETSDNTNNK